MWLLDGDYIVPLLPQPEGAVPLHSRQFQDLPQVYVQDSSLEISWVEVALSGGGDLGDEGACLASSRSEGLSIDYPEDWALIERLVADGEVALPEIDTRRVRT